MLFSKRLGFQAVRNVIQIEAVDQALCNGLWSVLYTNFFKKLNKTTPRDEEANFISYMFWRDYFKMPITSLPEVPYRVYNKIMKKALENDPWYVIYDLCEIVLGQVNGVDALVSELNEVLKQELSGYRAIKTQIVPLMADFEVESVDSALALQDDFTPVAQHLSTALTLLSDRSSPDFRNSIKESISAVEAMSQILGGAPSELGKALKTVERKGIVINGAVQSAFRSLYGFTSDEAGIRHALTETSLEVDIDDAKFMLVAC